MLHGQRHLLRDLPQPQHLSVLHDPPRNRRGHEARERRNALRLWPPHARRRVDLLGLLRAHPRGVGLLCFDHGARWLQALEEALDEVVDYQGLEVASGVHRRVERLRGLLYVALLDAHRLGRVDYPSLRRPCQLYHGLVVPVRRARGYARLALDILEGVPPRVTGPLVRLRPPAPVPAHEIVAEGAYLHPGGAHVLDEVALALHHSAVLEGDVVVPVVDEGGQEGEHAGDGDYRAQNRALGEVLPEEDASASRGYRDDVELLLEAADAPVPDDVRRVEPEQLLDASVVLETAEVAEAAVVLERPEAKVGKVLGHHPDGLDGRDRPVVQVEEVGGVEVVLDDVGVVDCVVEDGVDGLSLHVPLPLRRQQARVRLEQFPPPHVYHPVLLRHGVPLRAARDPLPELRHRLLRPVGVAPLRRNVDALSPLSERPAVVEALEPAFLDCAHGERRGAVRAHVGHAHEVAVGVAVDDEGLVPEAGGVGFRGAVRGDLGGEAAVRRLGHHGLHGRGVAGDLPGVPYGVPRVVHARLGEELLVVALRGRVRHDEVLPPHALPQRGQAAGRGVIEDGGGKVHRPAPARPVGEQRGVQALEELVCFAGEGHVDERFEAVSKDDRGVLRPARQLVEGVQLLEDLALRAGVDVEEDGLPDEEGGLGRVEAEV
mmetsp:Transcript_30360/g.60301  ORF Transcript_30360/g.60301 Transcript_30360/m.60301 type:complete len:659 (+) Transcript_30360:97-2073(+)